MQAGELRFSEWRDVVPDLHIVITDGWSVWSVCVCVCVCRGQGEKEHSLKQPGFQIGCHMDPVCCEVRRVVTSSLNTSNTRLV